MTDVLSPEPERAAGEDTAESINPQTLLLIVATIVMFVVLIFAWVFAGKILDKLGEGIEEIGQKILDSAVAVEEVGKVIVQEVLKGTGTVINQISGIITTFENAIGPILEQVGQATETLLNNMATSIQSIIDTLNTVGETIGAALNSMITQLNQYIGVVIQDTLGFIQVVFAPFFQS